VDTWLLWMVIAVVLAMVELLTLTAALGLLAGAALIASGAAALGLPVPVQLLVFVLASALGILVVRPAAARHILRPRLESFGVEALPGRVAYVVDRVTGRAGRVRIGGEEWSARALDEDLVIAPGVTVDVIRIDGATAVVHPRG
jgi:membrane protein implicated in regulation of membrane protease activity